MRINFLKTNHSTLNQNRESEKPACLEDSVYSRSLNPFQYGLNALSAYNKFLVSFKGNASENLDFERIKSLTADPRLVDQNKNILDSLNISFSDYKEMYRSFTESFYAGAESVDELLKYRPDWTAEKLIAKFAQNKPFEEFCFGEVPEIFGSQEAFFGLTEHIYSAMRAQADKKTAIHYNAAVKYDVPEFEFEGKKYFVEHIKGGLSGKSVFKITNSYGHNFIIKMSPEATPGYSRLDGCDSVGLNAKIDYYLTSNCCLDSAKLYYYTAKFNASLYEYIEKDEDQSSVRKLSTQCISPATLLKDLTVLGIYFNDTQGVDNLVNSKKSVIMLDSGHCTYSHNYSLKPLIKGYHLELPNLMAFNF